MAAQLDLTDAQRWIRTSKPGYCNATEFGDEGECTHAGDKGVLLLNERAAHSAELWALECLRACERCPRCRYISLSHEQRDCSWHTQCVLQSLHNQIPGFRSGRVRSRARSERRSQSLATGLPPSLAPRAPSPLPPMVNQLGPDQAFQRSARLTAAQLERGVVSVGGASRARRKLRLGRPVMLAAIGSSNAVRGGCEERQGGKCTQKRFRNGWLIESFQALNRSFPHAGHRLVNSALMATGPEGFVNCLSSHVPPEADIVILAFADICWPSEDINPPASISPEGTTLPAMEAIVRGLLLRRPEPPAIVIYNHFSHHNWNCLDNCAFGNSCDAAFGELARYYHVSTVSVRDALWHDATSGDEHRFSWSSWTRDHGKHLLPLGNKYSAELLHGWLTRAVSRSAPDAFPAFETAAWLFNKSALFGPSKSGDPPPFASRDKPDAFGALCTSFDDSFGGRVPEPRIVRAQAWSRTTTEVGMSGERKLKPGYSATQRGALLVVDTLSSGRWFQVGYLRSTSHAVAEVSCRAPCTCETLTLRARSTELAATTAFSAPHPFAVSRSAAAGVTAGDERPASRDSGCQLLLQLVSDGERFKFIALQVGQ